MKKIDWNKPVSKLTQLIFDGFIICILGTIIYLVIVNIFIPMFTKSHDYSSGQEMYNYIMSWEFIWIGIKFMIGFAVCAFSAMFIYLFGFNYYLTLTDQLEKPLTVCPKCNTFYDLEGGKK